MSEKFLLQWNDFKANKDSAFGRLRDDKEFIDVTLVCDDGQQMEAHKVILAASSPFFEKILSTNKHPHPLIYLKGFQSQDLLAILDFLYFGEANVYHENLDSFLVIAEELKLKGLTGQSASNVGANPTYLEPANKTKESLVRSPSYSDSVWNDPVSNLYATENISRTLTIPNELSGDLKALDEKVNSMMGKGQNMITVGKQPNGMPSRATASICKVCGKEDNAINIKNHIEANHLEGISLPCDHCDKAFSSRNAVRLHKCSF